MLTIAIIIQLYNIAIITIFNMTIVASVALLTALSLDSCSTTLLSPFLYLLILFIYLFIIG